MGIVAIGSLGALALWVLATTFHIELIPGSARIIRLVLPFPIAIILLSIDLFVTWAFCCEWKLKGAQFRFGTAILCASTLPALWAFADLCLGARTLFVERAALSAFLFVAGIGITPRPEPELKAGDAES